VSFEVLSLERRVEGSNLPLPKTLIRQLLNLALPPVSPAVGGPAPARQGCRLGALSTPSARP
jgi:hypothetical protein